MTMFAFRKDFWPPVENGRMALSSKEKQEAFRQRRAEQGLQEVRGIFLPPELHAELKAHAAKLLKKDEKVRHKVELGSRKRLDK
jgi:hypothetical protein